MRVGLGYDAHRLVAGRPLILGGVEIPHTSGAVGPFRRRRPDATPSATPSWGRWGPAIWGRISRIKTRPTKTSPASSCWNGSCEIVRDRGFAPQNVDATIVAQEPRLAPHIPLMQANLAPILGLTPAEVNVKATTTEHMGFAGRGEGMAAYAVVLVTKT